MVANRNYSATEHKPIERCNSNYHPLHTFNLGKDLQYKQQFADIYFLRLAKIKPVVEEVAEAAWKGTEIGGEMAKRVERVLDVRQGELCWVAGTVYMDMPFKPNILDDVSQDVRELVLDESGGVFTDLDPSAGSQPPARCNDTTRTLAVMPSCWKMTQAVFSSLVIFLSHTT